MASPKNAVAVVALVVCVATLAVDLGGSYVEAKDGCFKGVKSLFRSKKPTVAPEPQVPSAYELLADYVYGTTTSEELADNVKEAAHMLSEHSDAQQSQLVRAFTQLKTPTDDKDSLCGAKNLANVRLVAEAMNGAANKEATDSILRLNKIIVRCIAETSSVCFAHLEGKWPEPWTPDFKLGDGKLWISQLSLLPNSFLYQKYMTDSTSPLYDHTSFRSRMSTVLRNDDKLARTSLHSTHPTIRERDSERALTVQMDEYVHKPCKEFLKFDESKTLLAPYNDLLISWYIVTEGSLKRFYQSQGLSPSVPAIPFEGKINLVFGHRACTRLLAVPSEQVANMVSNARRQERGLQPINLINISEDLIKV